MGACWNFHDIAIAESWLESLVEVMAGADSGRCRLELYRDPSCLIGEAPESRKEVSRLYLEKTSPPEMQNQHLYSSIKVLLSVFVEF